MEDLKEFFKNIKRIADGVEFMANDIKSTGAETKAILDKCNAMVDGAIAENTIPQAPVQQPIPQPVQAPVQQTPIQTAIPVSNTVQTYTQDQLAVAMGRALDSGKEEMIRNILGMFNVISLMELKPEQYNDLALRLKEIGVDV